MSSGNSISLEGQNIYKKKLPHVMHLHKEHIRQKVQISYLSLNGVNICKMGMNNVRPCFGMNIGGSISLGVDHIEI